MAKLAEQVRRAPPPALFRGAFHRGAFHRVAVTVLPQEVGLRAHGRLCVGKPPASDRGILPDERIRRAPPPIRGPLS